MGWYIRKAWKLGPFRLNLSKSGLGWSVGPKGFRVGSGPKGEYLHAGRGGLYYRQSLSSGAKDSPPTDASFPNTTRCTVCGEENSASAQFCIGCGREVTQAVSTSRVPLWVKVFGGVLLLTAFPWLLTQMLQVGVKTPARELTAPSARPGSDITLSPVFRSLSNTQHLDAAEALLQRDPSQITAEQFSIAANHIAAVTGKKVSGKLKKRADKLAARLVEVAVIRNREGNPQ
jgi:hypothetical protein